MSASSTFAAMGRHGVLDRAVVAGGIDVRHIFDDVIAQNEINFTLPDLVAAEIYSTPTQSARLSAAVTIRNRPVSVAGAMLPMLWWTQGCMGRKAGNVKRLTYMRAVFCR